MKKLIILFTLTAGYVYAQNQTCIIPSPAAPPTPTHGTVILPSDGGTVGCLVQAGQLPGGGVPQQYPISNAKCATAVAMIKQAAANDNGWNDGGSP